MRRSWLYFATRSERAGAPVLIWPQFTATARSAIVVSLGLAGAVAHHAAVTGCGGARSTASSVSDRVPIWFTLTRSAFAHAGGRCRATRRFWIRDEQVVADELDATHRADSVSASQPAQSSSDSGVLDRDDRVRHATSSRDSNSLSHCAERVFGPPSNV